VRRRTNRSSPAALRAVDCHATRSTVAHRGDVRPALNPMPEKTRRGGPKAQPRRVGPPRDARRQAIRPPRP
jgi:hypothetical protein